MSFQPKADIGVNELPMSDVQSIAVSIRKEDGQLHQASNYRFQRMPNENPQVHSFSAGTQGNETEESLAEILMTSNGINSFTGFLEEVTPEKEASHSSSVNSSNRETVKQDDTGTSDVRICFHCKKFTNYVCHGCNAAWFCNKKCQQRSWKLHKRSCLDRQRGSTKRKRIYCKVVLEEEPTNKQ